AGCVAARRARRRRPRPHPETDARRPGGAAFLRLRAARGRPARAAPFRDGARRRALSDVADRAPAHRVDTAPRGRRVTAARPIVEARGVGRVFPMPAGPVTALRDVSLRIDAADYVAITGPSGCGKSTL